METYQKTSFNINNLLLRAKTTKKNLRFVFKEYFTPPAYLILPFALLCAHSHPHVTFPLIPYLLIQTNALLSLARILVLNVFPRSLCLKAWSSVSDTIRRWWGLSVVGHRGDFPMAGDVFAEEDCGALVSLHSL